MGLSELLEEEVGSLEDLPMGEDGVLEIQEEEQVVEVAIDWMSCTQSLRKTVEQFKELVYIPLDKQEWVFSQAMKGWVRNLPVDLEATTCEEIWTMVVQAAKEKTRNQKVVVRVTLLGMSPDCRTFTKTDSSNISRGHNYRLHGESHPDRPPRDDDSEKGQEAHRADSMVQKAIQFYQHLRRLHKGEAVPVYLENPVGSLARRPYNVMKAWVSTGEVRQEEVHYCVYDHMYNKPTHIWTSMRKWKPKGQSGNGRCQTGARCKVGFIGSHNKYVHQYKIAQGSKQAKCGKGRRARKNMMPAMLHRELLLEARKEVRASGRG